MGRNLLEKQRPGCPIGKTSSEPQMVNANLVTTTYRGSPHIQTGRRRDHFETDCSADSEPDHMPLEINQNQSESITHFQDANGSWTVRERELFNREEP